jgi:hypothetical protein
MSRYLCVEIALAYWSGCVDGRNVVTRVPAHTVYCSVPWIHPKLRRWMARQGRR